MPPMGANLSVTFTTIIWLWPHWYRLNPKFLVCDLDLGCTDLTWLIDLGRYKRLRHNLSKRDRQDSTVVNECFTAWYLNIASLKCQGKKWKALNKMSNYNILMVSEFVKYLNVRTKDNSDGFKKWLRCLVCMLCSILYTNNNTNYVKQKIIKIHVY